jgi:hypothetical protein
MIIFYSLTGAIYTNDKIMTIDKWLGPTHNTSVLVLLKGINRQKWTVSRIVTSNKRIRGDLVQLLPLSYVPLDRGWMDFLACTQDTGEDSDQKSSMMTDGKIYHVYSITKDIC